MSVLPQIPETVITLAVLLLTAAICAGSLTMLLLADRIAALRSPQLKVQFSEIGLDRVIERVALLSQSATQSERPVPSKPALPRVVIAGDTLHALTRAMRRDLDDRPDADTGFALVGRVDCEGENRRLIVNALIDAGVSDRSSGHVRFDRPYQQSRLEMLQLIDPRASHIGDAHTHPGGMDHCSEGDLRTDSANVKSSRSHEMVFVIATEMRFHRLPERDADSVYESGLKLDFFYLGQASGFQYAHVRPEIDDAIAPLAVPSFIEQFIAQYPDRFAADWKCLINLKGWQVRIGESKWEGRAVASIEMHSRLVPWRVVLIMPAEAQTLPAVYIEEDGALTQFCPEFVVNGEPQHVWLTEIVLSAIRARSKAPRACCEIAAV